MVSGKITFLWGKVGIRQVISLVMTQEFQIGWLKVTILGPADLANRSGVKPWFADVGLAQGTPFWTRCFFLNSPHL